MSELTVRNIIEATGGELLLEGAKTFSGVSIDTRTIKDGELFFAIRGERFNGHDFIEDALERGGGAVVDTKPEVLPRGKTLIYVSDTLRSLQDLAQYLREEKDIPVVAVTGSNGKTTTKEMLYSILSRKYRTLRNEGNLNNHIGLPLSLLKLDPDDEMIVLEMGMNASGEIKRLCEIARPSHGVITNIGAAHLGMLGSYEAVRSAKLEILDGLSTVIVNADDRFLMQGLDMMKNYAGRRITFAVKKTNNDGNSDNADVTAWDLRTTDDGTDFILEFTGEGNVRVSLGVHGLFNVYNALAATAVSYSLGMEMNDIKAGLEHYSAFPMRFEITEEHGMTIINDTYNANLSSTRESLSELLRLGSGGRKVAVLGDMLELGSFTDDSHREIGRIIIDMGIDVFVAVGEKMALAAGECMKSRGISSFPDVYCFKDAEHAGREISGIVRQNDTLLVKGSRSMTMEKIVKDIKNAV
ncbi:MAG: UDP-N-acetylmuramoyl-tripeptide--D-alanyl-D-alanine ligase [Nitrospiraceae bacterium]|nr:MAG: UDP-N-acetylmuramoyl-tripeptide--D-alanyl-D-alanine ligase [Nitrospiraceae bacterium]